MYETVQNAMRGDGSQTSFFIRVSLWKYHEWMRGHLRREIKGHSGPGRKRQSEARGRNEAMVLTGRQSSHVESQWSAHETTGVKVGSSTNGSLKEPKRCFKING